MLPGPYYVVALVSVPDFWMEPAYLETVVPSAVRVELRQASTVEVAVMITAAPQR
jgi:hypothetical protein